MDVEREHSRLVKSAQALEDLKRNLEYIDKTNWFFQKDTVSFT